MLVAPGLAGNKLGPWILDSLIYYLRQIFRNATFSGLLNTLNLILVLSTPIAEMSAAADKARYYLEQSVPELKELERKKIFAPAEITAIAKKRSDFEHKINARGSHSTDYIRYAEFEINVENLRKKRVKRLGIKGIVHSGQRRIFFVFDRGTRKFPGDVRLWMQSIDYARSQKALKKVTQMLTNLLRLHPAKAELWIYAAQFAIEENGDMTEARGYMQRGLRFCKNNKGLWLQNFRLELNWIAKIHARRRLLGIEEGSGKEEIKIVSEDDDVMMLPKLTAEDLEPDDEKTDQVDVSSLTKHDSTPIINGAIPTAIFDAAMRHFSQDPHLALKFYEEVQGFQSEDLLVSKSICSHIHHAIQEAHPNSWNTFACEVAMPLVGLATSNPQFPAAIRDMLSCMTRGLVQCTQRAELANWCQEFLDNLLARNLDPALKRILQSKRHALSLQS